MDGRTLCVKIVITIGRDCGLPRGSIMETMKYKTGVINDPLGQTHSLSSSKHVFTWNLFYFEKWGCTDVRPTYERTTCAKTVITSGHDCGSAEWINYFKQIIGTRNYQSSGPDPFQEHTANLPSPRVAGGCTLAFTIIFSLLIEISRLL